MKFSRVIEIFWFLLIIVITQTSGLDFGYCERTVARRILNNTVSPPQYQKFNETIRECCMGFTTAGTKCIPNCRNVCVNAVCIGNNKCRCNSGYYPVDSFRCLPKCEPACHSSMVCLAPDKCLCKQEYNRVNETFCEPTCSFTADNFECINAKCVRPNECECNEGFKKVSEFQCEPICTNCNNGDCVLPEVCECHEGYEKNAGGSCDPICEPKCVNARCVAPNTCKCDESFEKHLKSHVCLEKQTIKDLQSCLIACQNGLCSDNGTCICERGFEMLNGKCLRICDKKCVNGKCLEDQCVCDEGYKLSENSTECFPVCAFEDGHDCINGICVAPQTCQCFEGYRLLPTKNCTCVLLCDPPCINGICTEAGCVCHKNFYNISEHECVKNCSEGFKWVYDDCIEDNSFELFGTIDGIDYNTEPPSSSDKSNPEPESTTDEIESYESESDEDSSGDDDEIYDEGSTTTSTSSPTFISSGRDENSVEKSLLPRFLPVTLFVFVALIAILIISILTSFCIIYKRINPKNIYYVEQQEKTSNCVYLTTTQTDPAESWEQEFSC